ncbi:hypothetical protein A2Z00_04210 [Candidatus Gottesmanbacteria bacterium RBG_13_45_10]|uniref:Uncharacterized protein n=1 Tax=Candidatus Gottesmanbacteria bacterium RBG_13_45_10 TaxID=1798370 RepID=A0A1F5ZIH8_9BACT|nr:MAG: hypothetical protein A2Z00_04210 [Candidatus Gottesmanbacteria bacterium RBG_13_45_10]
MSFDHIPTLWDVLDDMGGIRAGLRERWKSFAVATREISLKTCEERVGNHVVDNLRVCAKNIRVIIYRKRAFSPVQVLRTIRGK